MISFDILREFFAARHAVTLFRSKRILLVSRVLQTANDLCTLCAATDQDLEDDKDCAVRRVMSLYEMGNTAVCLMAIHQSR